MRPTRKQTHTNVYKIILILYLLSLCFVAMVLWNYVMPVLGVAKINYAQTVALAILSFIFFGRDPLLIGE